MPALLEFQSITKRFGDNTANRDVSFSINEGTVHGIVGENGAGKSTIMKILYGLYTQDSGDILLRGSKTSITNPKDAIQLGIGMVHQHFLLVPTLTVWENVILGEEPTLGKLPKTAILESLQKIKKDFGFTVGLEEIVESLPVGLQQQVEILKVLYRKAKILIFDEPTAVLTPQEVEILFTNLSHLKDQGYTLILITHKLKEILKYTDTVTVMRAGCHIETVPTTSLTEALLAEKIIGRKRAALPERKSETAKNKILEVQNLSTVDTSPALENISFHIQEGEILGIAGIEGNGQNALIEAITGLHPTFKGTVQVLGSPVLSKSTYVWKQTGMGIVPPDRHEEGLVLDFTVQENGMLGHHRESAFTKGKRLAFKKIRAVIDTLLKDFDVRPHNQDLKVKNLSGGNQQKVIVGRETGEEVRFLVAAHPTRGVDIGAIDFIHSHFLRLREKGAGVLLVSSELEEILALSDRILVLYQGRIVGETLRKNATETQLGLWMTGGSAHENA